MTAQAPPRRARITTFGNLKGGSGKTTNAINLAGVLASGRSALGPQRVLLVDLEPLKTASDWLDVRAAGATESSAALFEARPPADHDAHLERLRSLVQRAPNEEIDVIASHPDQLSVVDDMRGREFDLKDNLSILADEYDHILLDLPGSRTGRLLRSALVASDGVIVPVQPGSSAITSSLNFFPIVEEIRRAANPALQVDGMILSDAGFRGDVDAVETQQALREFLPYPVFDAMIRTLKGTLRASAYHVSVVKMDQKQALADFIAFADEWAERVGLLTRVPAAAGGDA